MGQQIIKQPDGLFAIFSSVVEAFIFADGTAEDIADFFADQAAREARRQATRLVEAVAEGRARDVYFQFAMTWDGALAADREHGGEVHVDWLPSDEEAP